MISQGMCRDIPSNLASQIMQMSDRDNNGQLTFEEFYSLSQRHPWIVTNLLRNYCRIVVPSPHREEDQIGKKIQICLLTFLLITFYFQMAPMNVK